MKVYILVYLLDFSCRLYQDDVISHPMFVIIPILLTLATVKYSSEAVISLATAYTIAVLTKHVQNYVFVLVTWFTLLLASCLCRPISYLLFTNMTNQLALTCFYYTRDFFTNDIIKPRFPFMWIVRNVRLYYSFYYLDNESKFLKELAMFFVLGVILDLIKHRKNFFFLLVNCDPNKKCQEYEYCRSTEAQETYEHLNQYMDRVV